MTDLTSPTSSGGLSVVDELAAQLQTFSIQPLKHVVENLTEQKQMEQVRNKGRSKKNYYMT